MLQVLIVGCGNIAGVFDTSRAALGEHPLTHAGAYLRDGRFSLAACVEPDRARREAFMKDWGIPVGFPSIDEVPRSAARFDVVSICSPTDRHAADFQVSLELLPRLIFCEKPLTGSTLQSERLVKKCLESKILLAVNYTRRWDPDVEELRRVIEDGRWGCLRSIVGYYNKGLLNNGSHMLDLLALLLDGLRVVTIGKPTADFSNEDMSIPLWLESKDAVPVQIVCGHAQDFTLFELELVFANAVIRMEEGGLFWRDRLAGPSQTFPGYRVLGEGTRRAGGYSQSMLRAVDNIFDAIRVGKSIASTGESALATQRLCEQIRQS